MAVMHAVVAALWAANALMFQWPWAWIFVAFFVSEAFDEWSKP